MNSTWLIANNFTENISFDALAFISTTFGAQTSENALTYTIVYGFLLILGIGGNISTIIVIILSHSKRGWSGIDAYLLNLAVTDLLLCITVQNCSEIVSNLALFLGVPFEIYRHWRQYPWDFGEFICSGVAFVAETSLYASILTIMAFTFERYLAVKDPLKAMRSFSPQRTTKVIVGVWLLAMINAIPYAHFISVNFLEDPWKRVITESAWCAIHYTINAQVAPLFIYSAICFYVAPMIILMVLYVRIGLLMHKNVTVANVQEGNQIEAPPTGSLGQPLSSITSDNARSASSRHESKNAMESRRRSIKVLLAIVANFFLCYGLFHVQRLISVLVQDWHGQTVFFRECYSTIFPISGFLYHANPVLDPIFYSMMSRRFQKIYRRIICCQVCKPKKSREVPLSSSMQSTTKRSLNRPSSNSIL